MNIHAVLSYSCIVCTLKVPAVVRILPGENSVRLVNEPQANQEDEKQPSDHEIVWLLVDSILHTILGRSNVERILSEMLCVS